MFSGYFGSKLEECIPDKRNPAIALAENGIPDTSAGPVLTPNQDTRSRRGHTHTWMRSLLCI